MASFLEGVADVAVITVQTVILGAILAEGSRTFVKKFKNAELK